MGVFAIVQRVPLALPISPRPYLGHGVGLRERHYERALAGQLDVDWVEVTSENFFGQGGRPRAVLSRLRRELPVVLHGVSLGIGSPGPPSATYLSRLRELCDFVEPAWVSDHLCWTHLDGVWSHELLPLPRVESAIRRVADNVGRVQDALGRRILLENVSTYLTFAHDAMSEWEFLAAVAQRADCLILLDLNNILVSAHNHGFDPLGYLEGIPPDRVWQFHLARHSDRGNHRFDDHCGTVPEEVWMLFDAALRRFGPVSSLIEWDEGVPEWEILRAQQRTARRRADAVLKRGVPTAESDVHTSSLVMPTSDDSGHVAFRGGYGDDDALTALQRRLWSAIAPKPASDRRPDPTVLPEVAQTPAFSALQRVSVYADSIYWRLRGALMHDFPVLTWVMRRPEGDRLLDDFLLAVPSGDPDLGQFGAGFPDFLAFHALGANQPGLVGLARLERALVGAIDAADPPSTPAAADDLREFPVEQWPQLRALRVPGLVVLPVPFDATALWQAFRDGRPAHEGRAILEQPASISAVVWRRGFEVFHRPMEPAEGVLLSAWIEGMPLAAAIGRLDAENPPSPRQIVAWLERWLHDGLLARVGPGATLVESAGRANDELAADDFKVAANRANLLGRT